MSLPATVGPLEFKYNDGSGVQNIMSVFFDSDGLVSREYTADGEPMLALQYAASSEGGVVGDLALVANRDSDPVKIAKAAEVLLMAIARYQTMIGFNPGESNRLPTWPASLEMIEAEDGSRRPRGLAGMIRNIAFASAETTVISLPAFP